VDVRTRTVRTEDLDPLASAFADWPKPRELFETYARRVDEGTLDMVVASVDSQLAGYLLIEPQSSYPPFAKAGIPEIADFNVLRSWQRAGIGMALPDGAGVVLTIINGGSSGPC
jgi:GNAT superfamily N-acetyltransferase